MRSPALRVLGIAILALVVAACGIYGSATTATGSPPPAGFPVGTYQKATADERLTWTFRPDGIWTEVYERLDGSFTGPAKGRYLVTGGILAIDPLFPAQLEPSTHDWRLDGEELWTTFRTGTEDDAGFFANVDRLAWRPVK